MKLVKDMIVIYLCKEAREENPSTYWDKKPP